MIKLKSLMNQSLLPIEDLVQDFYRTQKPLRVLILNPFPKILEVYLLWGFSPGLLEPVLVIGKDFLLYSGFEDAVDEVAGEDFELEG